MENNEENPSIKNYVLIKLPVQVENLQKASDILGNKKDLYKKIKDNKDIDFDFFYHKLPLENFISNDILLQRKTYRNKKNKNKYKYKYTILGKISNIIQSFSLEDFIYINENKTSYDELKDYIITKDEYEDKIKNIKPKMNVNEECQIISNLISKKHEDICKNKNIQNENLENYFSSIQPIRFSNRKNSSQNPPKLLKDKILFE